MAQAAEEQQNSQSRELNHLKGIFPLDGITFEEVSRIDKNFAIPACGLDDYLWFGDSPGLLEKLKNSRDGNIIVINGISYYIPSVEGGRFFPILLPMVGVSHGDYELRGSGRRKGYSPTLSNTRASIPWSQRLICPENPILGKDMGLCPLWIQTPNGTQNQGEICELLYSLKYYALIFVKHRDETVDLSHPGLTWSPIVNVNSKDIKNWGPHRNIKYEPRPSPCSKWDSVFQRWIRPKPQTQLPGLLAGCVLIKARPCGIQWLRDRQTNKKCAYVKYVSCGSGRTYLGPDRNMRCSNWSEYKRLHKGKQIEMQIQCSSVPRFSLNAFKEGYEWDQYHERWVWSFPNGDCHDCCGR